MTLRLATPEEKQQRDILAHAAWGQRLDVPQFVAREKRLRAHPWASQGMQTWLHCDGANTVLSSCETFCMRSWHLGRYGNAYAVASVFTEPALRAKGHAVTMLQELGAVLRAQDPQAQASVLYSDVGETIYNRCGYHAAGPAWDWEAPALEETRLDVTLLHEQRLGEALREQDRTSSFGVEIGAGQLDWHLERERAYATLLGQKRPHAHGALHASASATWCASFKEGELVVLTLDARSSDGVDAVLAAARDAAAHAGLPTVRVWETATLKQLGRPQGFQRVARDGSIPMLKPLHATVDVKEWKDVPRAIWV